MTEQSLISDDLLRQLIAVGHVDLLVGVPTLNHGETIADVVSAVQASFLTHFFRQRTVLLHSDAGSTDDTVARVQECCTGLGITPGGGGLRTTHRISALRPGMPGRGNAVRLMFGAAELLQASMIVILDPDIRNITPQRIATLATPVRDGKVDFVAPMYERRPAEGLLVTQLLRPLVRSLYGWRLSEPLAGEFGCSQRFVESCLARSSWADGSDDVVDLWITDAALTGDFEKCQALLGPRELAESRPQPPLKDLFAQVVSAAFHIVDARADYWLTRTTCEDVPRVEGLPRTAAPASTPTPSGASLLQAFAGDVSNLGDILTKILTPATMDALVSASSATEPGPRYPADLWAATVGEFLVAYHHGVMRRDHIIQALLPLYTARVGSFLAEQGQAEPPVVDAAIESLCESFEQVKGPLVERWRQGA